ncbi:MULTISPECIES: YtxH domain-containing protein [Hymenobacter]|uniref:YtxH domain-containing protein n=1 Tax=Hymenobacter TaxID=89966 RepID=UPI001058B956|nr:MULTISPECIES: YtxH domain-containing protein [Hymenobacter]QIL77303.1 YtxH domain-containing protein [Hymenobacter sp. HDW8]
MKDQNGKIILSLLAGASAGIIAGLLLAPETGEETRTTLKKSASKFSDDLTKLFQDSLSKINDLKGGATPGGEESANRANADDILNSLKSSAGTRADQSGDLASAPGAGRRGGQDITGTGSVGGNAIGGTDADDILNQEGPNRGL